MLFRLSAERIRGQPFLTMITQDNRALKNGRELDTIKIQQFTRAVAASKKTKIEASESIVKRPEELCVL